MLNFTHFCKIYPKSKRVRFHIFLKMFLFLRGNIPKRIIISLIKTEHSINNNSPSTVSNRATPCVFPIIMFCVPNFRFNTKNMCRTYYAKSFMCDKYPCQSRISHCDIQRLEDKNEIRIC
jgi:hypothetical protein